MQTNSPTESTAPALELTPGAAPPRPKRRWQTRALTWVLGISVGLYACSQLGLRIGVPQATRSAADEKMVATAKALGGHVSSKGIPPGWEGWVYPEEIQIQFYGPNVDGHALDDAGLARFVAEAGRGPVGLSINDPGITGAGLRKFGGLTRLEGFSLRTRRRTQFPSTDPDGPIGPTSRPEMQVGAGDLAGLVGLPRLRMLYLEGVGFSADAFRGLSTSRTITNLTLGGSDVPDSALADIAAGFPELHHLNLSSTGVTDASLVHLAKLPKLSFLQLGSNPDVTPKGLLALKDLPRLSWLDLSGTRFTAAELAEFRAALPNIVIELGNRQRLMPMTATPR